MESKSVVVSAGRGRGHWKPNQDKTQLRRPQQKCVETQVCDSFSCNSENMSQSDNSDVVSQSTLSVEAKEFFPRNVSQHIEMKCSPDLNPSFWEEDQSDNSDQSVINNLCDVMEIVTHSPGQYEQLVTPLVKKLTPAVHNERIVKELVFHILGQALMENNFRYSGARLCYSLCSCQQPGKEPLFRRHLLNFITEFHRDVESKLELNPCEVHGFTHFLGELYLQMGYVKESNDNVSVLSSVLIAMLRILFKTPAKENVRTACKVFKLVGCMLTSEEPKEVESCISDLKTLLEGSFLDPQTEVMVQNLLDLYTNNWGQVLNADEASSNQTTSSLPDEIVMYGPDGLELTAEERKFLNESIDVPSSDTSGDDTEMWDLGEDVTDEVHAAFKEFLHEQKTRKPC